jgi:hypothetical protein
MTTRRVWVRRLLVVMAVIAAVVALGFLWRISPLKSLVIDDHGGHRPGGGDRPPGDRFGRGGAFSLGNIDDLAQSALIGVVVLAAVVAIDKVRRRRRPVMR